jgi:hypothetical protein
MTDASPPPRNRSESLRNKANEFFNEKKKRSEAFFEQMQTDRVVGDAKTAKLRALRLAKEAADSQTAQVSKNAKKAKTK